MKACRAKKQVRIGKRANSEAIFLFIERTSSRGAWPENYMISETRRSEREMAPDQHTKIRRPAPTSAMGLIFSRD